MGRHNSLVLALPMAVVWQEPAIAHGEAVSEGRLAKPPSLPPQTMLPQVVSPTEAPEDSSQELSPAICIIKAQILLSCACMLACVPAYRCESETYKGCSGILWHVSWHFLRSACQPLTIWDVTSVKVGNGNNEQLIWVRCFYAEFQLSPQPSF